MHPHPAAAPTARSAPIPRRGVARSLRARSLFAALAAAACAPRATPAGTVVEVTAPAPPPPVPNDASDASDAGEEPSGKVVVRADPPLPSRFRLPRDDMRPFAIIVREARANREGTLTTLALDAGAPPAAAAFERANVGMEQTSRRYASAFHAHDATAADRLDVLHEAADAMLAFSRHLDEAGVVGVPAAYRTDPRVGLTFEDLVIGPARRWREEGLSLARACVSLDPERAHPRSAACAALVRGSTRRAAHDAGTCGCAAGDPLCSTTLNGWCRTP